MRYRVAVISGALLLASLSTARAEPSPATQPSLGIEERIASLQSDLDQSYQKIMALRATLAAQRPAVGSSPSTQPDELVAARKEMSEALAKMFKTRQELVEAKEAAKAAEAARSKSLSNVPPNSAPREFNGVTYYIVPLS